jgi:hypothetical protein
LHHAFRDFTVGCKTARIGDKQPACNEHLAAARRWRGSIPASGTIGVVDGEEKSLAQSSRNQHDS